MSLMAAAAVAGVAVAGYGAYSSNRNARRAQDAQNRAMEGSTTTMDPFAVRGLGGTGAFWGELPNSASMNPQYQQQQLTPAQLTALRGMGVPGIGLGEGVFRDAPTGAVGTGSGSGAFSGAYSNVLGQMQNTMYNPQQQTGQQYGVQLQGGVLDPISAALSRYAGAGVPSFNNGLPTGVAHARDNLFASQGIADLDMNGLNQILGGANSAFTQAQQGLSTAGQLNGFDPSAAFGAATQQMQGLNQTYGQAYDTTLNTLRAQARPEEDRQFAGLTDNLFSTGRLGSSGGALQTEAFARGLGQADLSRQLAATTQAQQAQQNQLGLSQGLYNMGSSGTNLQDQLLNSAFGRFGQTAQMASDLNQQRFSRSMYGNETAYGRAQNMLGTETTLAGLPAALQGAQLGNVNSALQGQSGIQQQLLSLFGAGLSSEQAAANARIGAGSNMAQIVGSPNFGAAGQQSGAMWSQLGSALMNNSGRIGDAWGSMFGYSGINSPDAWGSLDQALASGQVGQ